MVGNSLKLRVCLGDTVTLQHPVGDIVIDWMLDSEAVIDFDINTGEAVLTVEPPDLANMDQAKRS
jgi:hypothetical protein